MVCGDLLGKQVDYSVVGPSISRHKCGV